MTPVRVLCAVLFFAAMAVVNQFVHFIVGLGYIPGILLIAGIFWIGIKYDNKERAARGEPLWSAYEAGQGVRAYFREPTPYILLGLLAFGFLVSRFT